MAEVVNSINSKNFETATKAFYSSVDGEKYIDFLIITVSSYKKHNNIPIDWIVICKDEDSLEHIKSMTEFLTDDTVKMVYTVMPTPPKEVDYSLYNSFKWTTDYASEIFCKRIYFVDVWKDRYDLLVCIDLDVLFIGDVKETVINFFNSECAIGGQYEYFNVEFGFSSCLKIKMPELKYRAYNYINFGFGMLNTRYLRNDNYLHFVEMSKGIEDQFNTQEQAYFAYEYQKSIKVYRHLQMHPHVLIRQNRKYSMIHFTPSKYITESMETYDPLDPLFVSTTLYFKTYALFALTCNISNKFRKTLEENLAIYCKKVTPSIIRRFSFSYCL